MGEMRKVMELHDEIDDLKRTIARLKRKLQEEQAKGLDREEGEVPIVPGEDGQPPPECVDTLCRPRCYDWSDGRGCLMVGENPANDHDGVWHCAWCTSNPPVPSREACEAAAGEPGIVWEDCPLCQGKGEQPMPSFAVPGRTIMQPCRLCRGRKRHPVCRYCRSVLNPNDDVVLRSLHATATCGQVPRTINPPAAKCETCGNRTHPWCTNAGGSPYYGDCWTPREGEEGKK